MDWWGQSIVYLPTPTVWDCVELCAGSPCVVLVGVDTVVTVKLTFGRGCEAGQWKSVCHVSFGHVTSVLMVADIRAKLLLLVADLPQNPLALVYVIGTICLPSCVHNDMCFTAPVTVRTKYKISLLFIYILLLVLMKRLKVLI